MEKERPLRILMLEDEPDDVVLIQRVLHKDNLNFVTQRVDTEQEFRTAIKSFQPDVVLSDHGLPSFNSQAALKICQKERALTPFILVTGTVSDDYALSCLREGADDYIFKSNLKRLPSAIRSAVKKRKLEKLKRDARHTLRNQNKELIRINHELDQLVYSVSHNLRGPLASVIGLLNVITKESDPEAIRGMHGMMHTSLLRLDETIHDILNYSRNAREEIHIEELDWQHIVDSCLRQIEHLDPERIVKTHVSLITHIPSCSDGSRIAIILNNILSNAFTYRSAARPPEVNIRVLISRTECKFTVVDNGAGITPEVLPNIFDMFYRGSSDSRGAGLGLYIAREVVKKLQGTIQVYSVRNTGTAVTVQLPNVTNGGFIGQTKLDL